MAVLTPAVTNPVPNLSTGLMQGVNVIIDYTFNPLNPEINPTCHLLTLLAVEGLIHNNHAQNYS